MDRIAGMVANEIASACAVLRLEGDALRMETIVHRDPHKNATVSRLRGQRLLRPEAERELVASLKRNVAVIRVEDGVTAMQGRAWPYLAEQIEALEVKATVIVPMYSAGTIYGALAAYYSDVQQYEPERDLPLLKEIAMRAAVAIERVETLERERRIATTLQQASLPALVPQPAGIHFDAVYLPAGDEAEVGGDWYDAIELDDGSVVISVGDVTGRGIQAAAIMSKMRHAMGMVPLHEPDPAKILDSAEWFLRKRYPDAIVTAFVAVISADRRTLRYANAGHPFPYLRRGFELTQLKAYGLPIGVRHLSPGATTSSIELQPGDVLVLYTDGLTEWNRNWEEGERLLADVLESGALKVSMSSAHLIARACLPPKAHDDVAILTVAFGEAPAWSFFADDARAAADARQHFMEFMRGRSEDPSFLARAELIFGELLGNVVRHAPGPVEIDLVAGSDGMSLHVIDSGAPFHNTNQLPADVLSELGRGLFIIQKLAKNVTIEHVPNCGNHVSVTL
jgi:anti-sigma regulatory factor (Ser/Thr protein kinase)